MFTTMMMKQIKINQHYERSESCGAAAAPDSHVGAHASRQRDNGETQQEAKRIVVIDQDKVTPNSEAYHYFRRHAFACGKPCIQVVVTKPTGGDGQAATTTTKLVIVSELACPTCVNRCKQCPGNVVSVVKLPTNLTTNTIHRYGPNSFKLHGLPIPRPGHVLGLLGTNGSGKSTALKILSGRIKPNLGNCLGDDEKNNPPPSWSDIVAYFRGSDLQNYFQSILENKLKVATKPQLEAGFVKRLHGKTVKALLKERDERHMMDKYCHDLELVHLMDRKVEELSGGELQRFAAACTMCRNADVYMFDEVTSFLDVKQRLKVTELIRDLVRSDSTTTKYVIVVEHDLAILDYMSDYIQCLYGSPGAYGVVTGRSRVRNGINHFLAGYIPADNMRFRDHELTFKVSSTCDNIIEGDDATMAITQNDKKGGDSKQKVGVHSYPAMKHVCKSEGVTGMTTTQFVLNVEAGSFREGECILLMGENGTGKTTFMEMLAGRIKKDDEDRKEPAGGGRYKNKTGSETHSLASLGVSYKQQGLSPKLRRFKGTVRDVLEKRINAALLDRLFRLLVMQPLKVDAMFDLPVATLSGGEMQRLSIVLCLGKSALFYLVDEPSAGLDCEQRVIAAKVMKRWVVNHLGRTLVVVEHDFVMATAMADRVVVYTGQPGVKCVAHSPVSLTEGLNRFLKALDVTFRRDPANFRPRINKKGSRIDREQRSSGNYYQLDDDEAANLSPPVDGRNRG